VTKWLTETIDVEHTGREVTVLVGRAVAQEVSRLLPRSGRMGFVVDKVALGRFSPS
jgi:hypothetical protein